MLFGLLNLSFWGYVIGALALTHITIVCVTVFLHRHQAHRALDLHPIVSHFFRFWLWLTTGMVTKEWVSIHRKHHAFTETPEDPHSPITRGINKVLWEGAELYKEASRDEEMLDKFGYGTPNDWIERNLYSPHSAMGIFVMLGIDLLLFGIPGITIWAVQMLWIPLFAAGVVNGIGHYWGYRNFECPDASTNIVPWGILIGGEELHNNHHTFATSAKLSYKWWEFDIGWMYIQIMSAFGLAKVRKVQPKLQTVANKNTVDVDTLKAILTNRFQILSQYAHDVIEPVLKQEKQQADQNSRSVFQRAKKLLTRDDSLLNSQSKQELESLLSNTQRLSVVYQFKQNLQNLWSRTTAFDQNELLTALQTWYEQAQASGIEVLQQFALGLPQYQTVKA